MRRGGNIVIQTGILERGKVYEINAVEHNNDWFVTDTFLFLAQHLMRTKRHVFFLIAFSSSQLRPDFEYGAVKSRRRDISDAVAASGCEEHCSLTLKDRHVSSEEKFCRDCSSKLSSSLGQRVQEAKSR